MFDAPILDVSLDEALAHFDLNVQVFEDQQPQTDSLLTEAQAQHLSAILEINEGHQAKFLSCVSSLEEML